MRSRFWSIVFVVLATAAAAALIGGVLAAGIVYVSAEIAGASAAAIATAVTAASWTGFYIGAGVGSVIGIIEGSLGNCPADGWFDTSIPLIDWEENCF